MWKMPLAWFQRIYQQYFRRSFFNKMFLTYLGITLLTGQLLFIVLSQNLISIKYDQALIMSNQCLTVIDTFLKNKIASAKSVHQRLYQEKEVWKLLMDEMQTPWKNSMYAFQQQEIKQVISNTLHAIDEDFNGLFLGAYKENHVLQYGTAQATIENRFFADYLKNSKGNNNSLQFVSSKDEKRTGNAFSIFIMGDVKDTEDFSKEIGAIGFYFNSMKIKQSYRDYYKYLKGTIYVVNEQGELLFDSESNYQLPDNFPVQLLAGQKSETKTMKPLVYNIYYSQEYGYYIINAFPIKAVVQDVKTLQTSMLGVFAIALFVALVLNYISIKLFAKRLKPITDTMEQIRNGHLTSFSIQEKHDDEVGCIYTELLRMCASLDDYIQREYVYRLRQKEMELYTLQAQIDPHFLYNSLEAIRMNLYVSGEMEASKMIWVLSDMFRNMMKKDAVVTNREELNYLHSYLELFRFRLGCKMTFHFRIDEEVYRYASLKHILQPIVENALVHGIQNTATEKTPSAIVIAGIKEGNDIVFTVEDNGCGIDECTLKEMKKRLEADELFQESIGIYNVNNRLRIVYGYSYKLHIQSEAGKGTKVYVRIKAMKKKELEDYVQSIDR